MNKPGADKIKQARQRAEQARQEAKAERAAEIARQLRLNRYRRKGSIESGA